MAGKGITKRSGMDLCTGSYIRLVNYRLLHRSSLKCSLMRNCIATTEGKKKNPTPKQTSAQDIRNSLLRAEKG